MNVVPGMVTQFAFIPVLTTEEMRNLPEIIKKVKNINDIRSKKSTDLIAKGEVELDPYTFDFLLLCNKICGTSHYNMQMKVVVDTPEQFNQWLGEQGTLVSKVNAAKAAPAPEAGQPTATDSVPTNVAPVAMNN